MLEWTHVIASARVVGLTDRRTADTISSTDALRAFR